MKTITAFALITALSTGAAQAHVTLEEATAPAGSTYRAVLRIGHGCEGQATQRVTVEIPAGVTDARPMPKAGWTLAIDGEGENVRRIVWEGSLDDASYDEFTFRVHLGDDLPADAPVYFPATQEARVNIPPEGTAWHDTEFPAPVMMIEAADPHAHH